ncbi:hypothetical protein [Phenylobacterium sp.]|uniref:hypothetical protein n=1 Tax=Phenylobacterium sp. TaxID=1871053 RepID=UPI002C731021|nr:hypothetical protein [Phenylobacterium sp.]HLZ76256.1 hypothetical protein [Phenylobacterium sp.]
MKDVLLVALAILALGAAAQAQPKPAPAAAPSDPAAAVSETEELTVTAQATCLEPKPDNFSPRPKVLSTFPANGAVVRPGVLVLRITFDQPMSCKGFFTGIPKLRNPCPLEHQHWLLSFDRRTIRTTCRAEGVASYGVGVSDNPDATFLSLAGRPLEPYEFRFTTSAAPDVLTPSESLGEDPANPPPKPEFVPLELQTAHVRK